MAIVSLHIISQIVNCWQKKKRQKKKENTQKKEKTKKKPNEYTNFLFIFNAIDDATKL